MTDSESDAIVAHCLVSDEATRMAVKVWQAFEGLRSAIENRFIEGLTEELRARLPQGWIVEKLPIVPAGYDRELIRLRKPSWNQVSGIALAMSKAVGSRLYFRVRDLTGKAGSQEIRQALNSEVGVGEKTAWSEWWRNLEPEGLEEVVSFLRRPESVQKCCLEILEVTRIAAPLVDRILADRGEG